MADRANGMIDKQEAARAFGRASAQYDMHAVLQREISSRLAERLTLMRNRPERILDAGSGTGEGVGLLRQVYAEAEIICLDFALPMLQVAREKYPQQNWLSRILGRMSSQAAGSPGFLCADMESLPLKTSSCDMIWSSLALQWANDLPTCLAEWHRVLAPNGLLMFATFGPDTLKELRKAFASVDAGEHVSRFTDLHDIGDMLVHAGFQHPVMEMEMLTFTYPDLGGLLRDLKGIGAHNAAQGRQRGLMGKSAWNRFQAAYEQFRQDGRLPATYEVIYGHAWVGDKLRLEDGRQVIQFKISQRRGGS